MSGGTYAVTQAPRDLHHSCLDGIRGRFLVSRFRFRWRPQRFRCSGIQYHVRRANLDHRNNDYGHDRNNDNDRNNDHHRNDYHVHD